MPYNGDGFKLSVPAKWNPSKEREFPGQVLRYEDNFDATSNLSVMVNPTDKKSITDYGSPEEFLSNVQSFFVLSIHQIYAEVQICMDDVFNYFQAFFQNMNFVKIVET